MQDGLPEFGVDYDLARWSDGSRDENGHLVWHESYPDNDQWGDVRLATIDLDPNGEHDYRNAVISPDAPLDPYGTFEPGDDFYFDLDDLVGEMLDAYGMA